MVCGKNSGREEANFMNQKQIVVQGIKIVTLVNNQSDYISLTDIARYLDKERTNYIIQNWMRNYSTIEFLGLWEQIHNPTFKGIEFDAFKNQAGANSFSLTPKKWVETTNAIGVIAKSGRYGGGIFAHQDIAFEFASWISAEFKLYLIKEFQRLKEEEHKLLATGWEAKRMLTRVNYKVHTDAVKDNLVPKNLTQAQIKQIYANEADVLNMALFGLTAKAWRIANPSKKGNLRDYCNVTQLVCMAGLESLNAEFIRQGLSQSERLSKLNQIAIIQMRSLTGGRGGLSAGESSDKS